MTTRSISFFSAMVVLFLSPLASYAALASKATGKAVTSTHLSTNPTQRQQQLLVDPDMGLTLKKAKLDVLIHIDTPAGVTAQDLIDSIDTAPLEHFQADGALPYYHTFDPPPTTEHFSTDAAPIIDSFNVFFDENNTDVLIKNLAVEYIESDKPGAGEVIHASATMQFVDPAVLGLNQNVYDHILVTYLLQTNVESAIVGIELNDPNHLNEETTFGPDDIDNPAPVGETLSAPEPAVFGPLAFAALAMIRRRRASR